MHGSSNGKSASDLALGKRIQFSDLAERRWRCAGNSKSPLKGSGNGTDVVLTCPPILAPIMPVLRDYSPIKFSNSCLPATTNHSIPLVQINSHNSHSHFSLHKYSRSIGSLAQLPPLPPSSTLDISFFRKQTPKGLRSRPAASLPLISLPASFQSPPQSASGSPQPSTLLQQQKKREKGLKTDQSDPCSYSKPDGIDSIYQYPGSCFTEIMDIKDEAHPAYTYLAHPARKGRAALRGQRRKGGWRNWVQTQAQSKCTCAPRLYLDASLHYKLMCEGGRRDEGGGGLSQLRLVVRQQQLKGLRQVLVLHFEGVLGDHLKPVLIAGPSRLILRKAAVCGLLNLAKQFRLVLVSGLGRRVLATVINCFVNSGVVLEAVYAIVNQEGGQAPLLTSILNYSLISSDLCLSDPLSQLLIVTRLDLSSTDLSSTPTLHYRAGTHIRLFPAYMPIPNRGAKPPVAFLVPSIRSQSTGEQVITFDEVASAIVDFGSLSNSSWVGCFQKLAQTPAYRLLPRSSSAVNEILLSAVLPHPSSTSISSAISCELHKKPLCCPCDIQGQFLNNAVVVSDEGRTTGEPDVVEVKKGRQGDSLLMYTLR